jgi:VIT1/CCC1 family predicted Fe2+/Mn2+ transporter
MLSTIVMTLLAIWLSLLIVGQVIGGYVGYNIFKSITQETKDK